MKLIAFKIWLIALLVCTIIYGAFLGVMHAGPLLLIVIIIEVLGSLAGLSIFIISVVTIEKLLARRRSLSILSVYMTGFIAVWISMEIGWYILSIMVDNGNSYQSLIAGLWVSRFQWGDFLLFYAPALGAFTLSFLFHLPALYKNIDPYDKN